MPARPDSKPSYTSLSHIVSHKMGAYVRIFTVTTGRELNLTCPTATIYRVYYGIFKALQGTPKTRAEVMKALKLDEAKDIEFAELAFDALLSEGMIAETTGLAGALSRTWQVPQPYPPRDSAKARGTIPYDVEPGLASHPFPRKKRYERQSVRLFDPQASINLDDLQTILADSYRTGRHTKRPLPSPGGIYPIRLHVINHRDGLMDKNGQPALDSGIYQYDPLKLSLERQTEDGFPADALLEYLTDDPDSPKASLYIAISVDVAAFANQFGNASLMLQGLAAGSAMQRLTDIAERLNLGTLAMFSIRHLDADHSLKHPKNVKTVLLVAIGKPGKAIASLKQEQTGLLQKLRVGSQKLIRGESVVEFGDPRTTGIPNTFVEACVKYPQMVTTGKTVDGHSFGAGYTTNEALVKATAEALERISSANVRIDAAMKSAAELKAPWIDPQKVLPLDKEQLKFVRTQAFGAGLKLNWTRGARLGTGEAVYAPSSLVYYPYVTKKSEPIVAEASSNGVAAHFDRQLAIQGGLLELIERDAIMRMWILRQPPDRIDPASLPPSISYRVKEMGALGTNIEVLNITQGNAVPAYMVVVRSRRFPHFFAGASCRMTADSAIKKAFEEAIGGFVSRSVLEKEARELEAKKGKEGIFDPDSHGMYYAESAEARAAISWMFEGRITSLPAHNNVPTLKELADKYNPAVFDIDNPIEGNDLKIVRVICDQLIPIDFGEVGVPYLHHTLPAGTPKPKLPHFFN